MANTHIAIGSGQDGSGNDVKIHRANFRSGLLGLRAHGAAVAKMDTDYEYIETRYGLDAGDGETFKNELLAMLGWVDPASNPGLAIQQFLDLTQ